MIISFLLPKINILLQFPSAPEWAHFSWYCIKWHLKANCIDRPSLNKITQQEPSRSNCTLWIWLWLQYSNNEKSNFFFPQVNAFFSTLNSSTYTAVFVVKWKQLILSQWLTNWFFYCICISWDIWAKWLFQFILSSLSTVSLECLTYKLYN